jgi:hypothetical protein
VGGRRLGAVGSGRIHWLTIASTVVLESSVCSMGLGGEGVQGIDHRELLKVTFVFQCKIGELRK